ncbi:hypothetical protein DL96DRAFT_1566876 [Flagelloscypha sp. PMI_526]|nr:hypothetical protein DL96DRAFT_1566876 [Flagelloscypha sp. PMI_526]
MMRRMDKLAGRLLPLWRRGNRLLPMLKPLKPALRHTPLKPFSLDVGENKYEKEGDKDEDSKDKRDTVMIDRVPSMGPTIPAEACTSVSTRESCFIARAPTKTTIAHFPRHFSTQCILSCSFRCLSPGHFSSHKPNAPHLPAHASSGAAGAGPRPVTKLPFPPPVPGVSSPRLPKHGPLDLPLSSPPTANIQATSIGQEESGIEKDSGYLIRTGALPLRNTTATTGMSSLTTSRKELAWAVRPVDDLE